MAFLRSSDELLRFLKHQEINLKAIFLNVTTAIIDFKDVTEKNAYNVLFCIRRKMTTL